MAGKSPTTNAGQEKRGRGGNNNPTGEGKFTGADDPRRNNNGQRNAAAVTFAKEVRAVIVEMGDAERAILDQMKRVQTHSNLEWAVLGLYVAAAHGNVAAFEALVSRVEGKVPQVIDATVRHEGEIEHSHSFEELRKLPADELARLHGQALAEDAATERRW